MGKSKFQGTNEQPPIIRFVLIPCRSAPAKRKKRPVCCVLLLYFLAVQLLFLIAPVLDFCTWLSFQPFSGSFISFNLKVSKTGWVHSPNQLITLNATYITANYKIFLSGFWAFGGRSTPSFTSKICYWWFRHIFLKVLGKQKADHLTGWIRPYQAIILTMIVVILD